MIRSKRRVLPGFGLSLGITAAYFGLIVLLPLAALVIKAATASSLHLLVEPRTLAAFRVSLLAAGGAALASIPPGVLLAWVLERYTFPGRRVLDACVDLPFALPTAVAGVALTTLYASDGWIGQLLEPLGIQVAYTPLGIFVALFFVGFPFVVRTVQSVLAALDPAEDEAALLLGAAPLQIFRRVILPALLPAIGTGAALAFARGIGEYGSVIFIAGNRPLVSEIVPLLIVTRLEEFDYPGAALLGTAMLLLSFVLLAVINRLRRSGAAYAV